MRERGLNILIGILLAAIIAGGITLGGLFFFTNYIIFQGDVYSMDTTEISITVLENNDVKKLDRLKNLTVVDAVGCEDYEQLIRLQLRHPDCQVRYTVSIDGTAYPQDAQALTITALTDEEMAMLEYLPELTSVDAEDCEDYAQLEALAEAYPELEISYHVEIAGEDVDPAETALTLEAVEAGDLMDKLVHLPLLETVHLINPEGNAEELLALRETYEQVEITWEVEICGTVFPDDTDEVDLSAVELDSLEDVEKGMALLPEAETLILGLCGVDDRATFPDRLKFDLTVAMCTISNEDMAALREENREDYKVIWSVEAGSLVVRTDETSFIPVKHNVYYFHDDDVVNLRYCEEMIAVDLGHMTFTKIDWVEYMPNLKYLILAHTTVTDITSLNTCKELLFLELDFTGIKDYTPLLGCTKLEDLNLGLTYGDIEPICQMTWLKNLNWSGRESRAAELREALPDTNIQMPAGDYTVGNGWRQLQNYYDMRDILGMEYMR